MLKEIIEGKIQLETRKFISVPVVGQQELDYGRGLMRGLLTVLDVIEKGEKEFERALQQARQIEAEEEQQ